MLDNRESGLFIESQPTARIKPHGLLWINGNSGLCQSVIAVMPPHDTYNEIHLGGGAMQGGQLQRSLDHRAAINNGSRQRGLRQSASSRFFPAQFMPAAHVLEVAYCPN